MDTGSLEDILNSFRIFSLSHLGINIDLNNVELHNKLAQFFSQNIPKLPDPSGNNSINTPADLGNQIDNSLFEYVPDAIVGINRQGTIVLFNKQAEVLFGYDRTEALGKWIEMLMPQRYEIAHHELISRYFHNPIPRPMGSARHDMWGRKKNGVEFPIDISLNYLESDLGLIAISAIRDISERKSLYQALAVSQQQLREITSDIPAVVFQAQYIGLKQLRYTFISAGAADIFEESPEDICNGEVLLYNLFHPDDALKTWNAIERSNLLGNNFSISFRIITRSGKIKWIEALGHTSSTLDGSLVRNGCFLDITAKKEADMKLADSLAFSNSLLDATGSQLAVIDNQGIITSTNKAWEQLSDLTPDASLPFSPVGANYFLTLQQRIDAGDAVAEHALMAIKSALLGQEEKFEQQYCIKSGKAKRWFLFRIVPVPGLEKRVLLSQNEITDFKETEQELVNSKRMYRHLLDTTDEMINTVGLNGEILWANNAWKKTMQYEDDDLKSIHLQQLLSDETRTGLEERLSFLRSGNAIKDFNGALIAKNGNVVNLQGTIVPIIEEGQIKGTQGFFRNLSELTRERNERIRVENRLSNILDKMLTGCIALGFDWSILYINNAAAIQAHEAPEDLIGKSIFDVFPAYLNPKVFLRFRQAMKSRKLTSFEEKYTFENGSVKWLEVVVEPIDEGIFIMSTDISEKIHAEERIRKQQLLLSESQRIARLGSWEYEIQNNHLTWSDEVYRIFEIEPGKFEESLEAFFAAIHPEDVEMVDQVYKHSLREKTSYEVVHRLRFKDGRIKYVHERGENFFDRHGNPTRTVGTVLDITKEKEAEIQLEENKTKYEQVVNKISDGLMVRDAAGKIIFANQQFLSMFGLAESEIASISFIDLVAPEHRDFMTNNHLKRFKGEHLSENYEFLGLRKDGQRIWLDVRVSTNADRGAVESVQAIVRDVTERKHAEEVLENQNRELKKINAELDRFVYSTSHDLRAPLMSLLGLIDLCRTTVITDEAHPYFNMMEDSIVRIDETIKEILAYSRNSRMEVVYEQLDLRSIINKYIDSILHSNDAQNIIFDIEIHEHTPFFCDKFRMSTIVGNLVSNAVKYQRTEEPTKSVWVRFTSDREYGILTVRDNGEGIPPDKMGKVMEMFYRNSVKSDGSGLGLYICREIVAKLGGQINIDSKLHSGSTFTVTIPNHPVNKNEIK